MYTLWVYISAAPSFWAILQVTDPDVDIGFTFSITAKFPPDSPTRATHSRPNATVTSIWLGSDSGLLSAGGWGEAWHIKPLLLLLVGLRVLMMVLLFCAAVCASLSHSKTDRKQMLCTEQENEDKCAMGTENWKATTMKTEVLAAPCVQSARIRD